MSEKFDPEKAIDFSTPNPKVRWFGIFGVEPSRPCDSCGNDTFSAVDWNMGYACNECRAIFGTKEEWKWLNGS